MHGLSGRSNVPGAPDGKKREMEALQETMQSLYRAFARPLQPIRRTMRAHLVGNQELRRQYLRPDFPYVLGISLIRTTCNLRCRMCPMFNIPPKDSVAITDEIMERALAPIGDREVSLELTAYADPLQHPRALDYLDLARRKAPKAHIIFVTNGQLLTERRTQRIIDSGIDAIQISLDAGSAESYQWLTGSTAYDRVCRNVERLIELRERQGVRHPTVQTHIIGIKELAHEFAPFIERWINVADHVQVRPFGNWGGAIDPNGLTASEGQKLPKTRYPCMWPWYATKIEPDGNVVKCHIHVPDHDQDRIGNLLEQDFTEIWRGEALREVRELHLQNRACDVKHCETCNVWSLFPNIWKRKGMFSPANKGAWQ